MRLKILHMYKRAASKEVLVELGGSPSYKHGLNYWRPLLMERACTPPEGIDLAFLDFVERVLIPQMQRERSGRQILGLLLKSEGDMKGVVQKISESLLQKEIQITVRQIAPSRIRTLLFSPLSLAALAGFLIVGSVHMYAFMHSLRNELEVLYLSPVLNIGVICFVVPALYTFFKKILK